MLQTYDPKAMYHILIKEADFWPKRTTASECVSTAMLPDSGEQH